MIVVQLSDPHIVAPGELLYDRVDTAEFLARSVAEINRLDPLPDVAVVTGDLVDHGNPAEYEHLRTLLAPLAMPVFVIPGNHDAREPLRAAFAADGYLPADGFLQFAIEDYSVRLVALDTLIPGEGGGLLCTERLAWLDQALASAPARPVLMMMHHPPFLTGIERMDRAGLKNSEALFRREARQGTYVMHFAASGAEALDRLAGKIQPTLVAVLSDINMPGMDGLQLLGEIKQRLPDLPVMMVTAYGDDERRRRAGELGASEFIGKPVDFDLLKEQLRQLSANAD